MKKKKKAPLTSSQAVFVLKGMLATIERIKKDCQPRDTLTITKAKASIHALILTLKDPYYEE